MAGRCGGRRLKLTEEQAAELRRRYMLWRENAPKRLMGDFGVTKDTLLAYATGRHKTRPRSN